MARCTLLGKGIFPLNAQKSHKDKNWLLKATFPASLDCLKPMGCFVRFGVSSGPIESFNIMMLAEKGSLYATWPVLTQYLAKREDILSMSQELFDVVGSGAVAIRIHDRLSLAEAATAHRLIESRKIVGGTVLLP
jgi:NADPH2:quinone reductase